MPRPVKYGFGGILDRLPLKRRPLNGLCLRGEAAAGIRELAAAEELGFPPVALAVESKLTGHRGIIERADKFKEQFAGFRLPRRWWFGVPEQGVFRVAHGKHDTSGG